MASQVSAYEDKHGAGNSTGVRKCPFAMQISYTNFVQVVEFKGIFYVDSNQS
jgi:hypothetical protein